MASRRKIAWCLRAAAICVAGLNASLGRAAPTGDTTPTTVAPNQSISLTDVEASPQEPTVASAPTTPAGEPRSPDQATAPVESSAGASSPSSTKLRRRGATGLSSGDSLSSGLSVPWYRSGFVSLGVVLGVIGAVYWLTRKLVPALASSDGTAVRVVARTALSPKHNVALLRVGRRFVLVGLSGERMSPLAEITDGEEVAELLTITGAGSRSSGDAFENVMSSETDAFDVDHHDEATDADPIVPGRRIGFHGNALSQLKDRLRGLQRKT